MPSLVPVGQLLKLGERALDTCKDRTAGEWAMHLRALHQTMHAAMVL